MIVGSQRLCRTTEVFVVALLVQLRKLIRDNGAKEADQMQYCVGSIAAMLQNWS